MNRPIHILVFEPYLAQMYGNQRYILTIFKFLDRRRFRVQLLSPCETTFGAQLAPFGGTVRVLPAPAPLCRYGGRVLRNTLPGKLRALLAMFWYALQLRAFLMHEKIDIVQCHNLRALLLIGPAAKLARIPVIWYIKGHVENPRLDRLGFRLADHILFQNETNKTRAYPALIQRYAAKIGILRNGIDIDEIRQAQQQDHTALRRETGIRPDTVNIGYVGYLSPKKGVHHLIDAMAAVQQQIPDAALYLIGGRLAEYPDYQEQLERQIRERRLEHIHFLGWREDVHAIVNLLDLIVLPSLSEGVPKSLIEAMALGKPVVASRVGGVPELIRHEETGLLVDPDDSAALAAALLRLANDPALRADWGQRAQQIAYRDYSVKDNIRGLEALYQRIQQTRK